MSVIGGGRRPRRGARGVSGKSGQIAAEWNVGEKIHLTKGGKRLNLAKKALCARGEGGGEEPGLRRLQKRKRSNSFFEKSSHKERKKRRGSTTSKKKGRGSTGAAEGGEWKWCRKSCNSFEARRFYYVKQ